MDNLTQFFTDLDALKLIERKSYVGYRQRRENSAEHSWHLAMACWAFAKKFQRDVDLEKLLKLALIHDLGEIEAGDTFLYDDKRSTAADGERKGVEVFNNHPGNPDPELLELWDEQEYGHSPETKILKVMDRLLPFLLNLQSEGKPWMEHGITRTQVLMMHGFIEELEPELFTWMRVKIEVAVEKGWLIDA